MWLTPTIETGPSAGPLGGGKETFLYIDASSPRYPNKVSHLVSAAGAYSGVYFKYHMFGADIGTLELQVDVGNGAWLPVWHQFGQVQSSSSESWREVHRTFPATAQKVRFVSVTGQGFKGDTAIGDVILHLALEEIFTVTSGQCTVVNDCFASPNYPAKYGDNQTCKIAVNSPTVLSVNAFSTESGYDVLNVNGVSYSGSTSPNNVVVAAGSAISWASDASFTRTGFRVCTGCRIVQNSDADHGFNRIRVLHSKFSDTACRSECTFRASCLAWVRQLDTGECWLSDTVPASLKMVSGRNYGTRCDAVCVTLEDTALHGGFRQILFFAANVQRRGV